jgi:hypothetical protein
MRYEEAKAIIEALVTLRESATDEQAAQVPAIYPMWREGVEYPDGARVQHKGTLYRCTTAHASQADWAPDAAPSLFAKVLIPDADVIPAWEQPESTNPYMTGDKVEHDGRVWVSLVDNNVWEPSVYGWEEVTA